MNEIQRTSFLRQLYELTDRAELNRHCKASEEVGGPLGLDEQTVRHIVQYFEAADWIKVDRPDFISFTKPGQQAARQLFEEETPSGPPIGFRP